MPFILMRSAQEYNDEITEINSQFGEPLAVFDEKEDAENELLRLLQDFIKTEDLQEYTYEELDTDEISETLCELKTINDIENFFYHFDIAIPYYIEEVN